MAEPFLALVTPLAGGDYAPAHPIAPGGPPTVGGGLPPTVGGGPILPPPSVGGGPIEPPPGIWPPPGQPGHDLPGRPIVWPRPPEGWVPPWQGKPPGVWPPPGHPGHPLPPEPPPTEGEDSKPEVWPPDHHPGQPLPPVIPIDPEEPEPQPPGTIWPPVDGMSGKAVILVWVPFVGFKWVVVDFSNKPVAPDQPPTAQPK